MLQRVEMPKPFGATLGRVSRYFTTFKWFLGRTLEIAAPTYLAVLLSSAAARVGNLIAFLVAIKCASLLLSQDHVPEVFAKLGVTEPSGAMFTVLLLVLSPLLFLGSAFAQNILTQCSGQLKAAVGLAMAARATQRRAARAAAAVKDNAADQLEAAKVIGADFGSLYRRVQRAEMSLINMSTSANILILAVLIGLYIDPYLMGVTMGAACVLLLCYLWFRHGHTLEHAARHDELSNTERAGRVTLARSIRDWLAEPNGEVDITKACADYEQLLTDQRKLTEQFRTQSVFMMNLGQALLMLTFLVMLKDEASIDTSRFAELAALLLILRFSLSAMQVFASSAVLFSRDYPMLNALRTGESTADLEEQPTTITEFEEDA